MIQKLRWYTFELCCLICSTEWAHVGELEKDQEDAVECPCCDYPNKIVAAL